MPPQVPGSTRWARHFRRLRKRTGLSQVAFAERAGITQPEVSAYERGEYEPRMQRVMLLAEALGCDVEELLVPSEDDGGASGDASSED